jgi:hypothetical protein
VHIGGVAYVDGGTSDPIKHAQTDKEDPHQCEWEFIFPASLLTNHFHLEFTLSSIVRMHHPMIIILMIMGGLGLLIVFRNILNLELNQPIINCLCYKLC